MISDYSFAMAADALLEEGRVDEALQLIRRGIAEHPLYAAGHIMLARVHIAQKSWETVCEPLERALQLDGPTPALLEMLAMRYDESGQIDLALECRSFGRDLDMRPLTGEEHEGGPEMVDERADDLEPGDEIVEKPDEPRADNVQELDDLGSPEDALKELEALLDGAGSSIEGNQGEDDLEETPPESEESELSVEEAGGDSSKDDIWKKIMEQADTVEDAGYRGMENLESLIGDPESEAEPVADPESEAEPVEEVELTSPEKEEPVEAAAETSDLELEGALPVEDTGDEKREVSIVEGLETGSAGDAAEDLPYSETSEGEGELSGESGEEEGKIASAMGEEGMVLGPVELSEEAVKEAAEGLDLDDGYDVGVSDDGAADETAADKTEPSSDVEAALQALESDLDMKPDEAIASEQLDTTGLEDVSVGLEETALDEIAIEETETAGEEGVEGEEGEGEGKEEEALPYSADKQSEEVLAEGGTALIKDAEDSIKLAIQAEILVAKGHAKEATRLLEALHLWEPDRASYKERLEELRRLQD